MLPVKKKKQIILYYFTYFYVILYDFINILPLQTLKRLFIIKQQQNKYNQRDIDFYVQLPCVCFPFSSQGKVFSWFFQTGFFPLRDKKKWFLVALDRWLSDTVTIVLEFTWADSALAILEQIQIDLTVAEFFNKCLTEPCFPDCWKDRLSLYIFKNVGERSTAKNYNPVSLLSLVSKVFGKTCKQWNCLSPREMWSFFLFPVWFQVFSINCRCSYSCI